MQPLDQKRKLEIQSSWPDEDPEIWRRELSGPKENLEIQPKENQKDRETGNTTKGESRNSTKRESEKSTHRTPDRKGMRKLYLRADQPADYFTDSHLDRNQVLNSYHPSIHPSIHPLHQNKIKLNLKPINLAHRYTVSNPTQTHTFTFNLILTFTSIYIQFHPCMLL